MKTARDLYFAQTTAQRIYPQSFGVNVPGDQPQQSLHTLPAISKYIRKFTGHGDDMQGFIQPPMAAKL